jgi:hypothetical protein
MSEGRPTNPDGAADPIGRMLESLARASAVFGGLVLTAAMVATVVSVIGRALVGVLGNVPGFGWMGPIPGDYEIVEIGAAMAVAAFLPICQLRGGHVIVDLFFAKSGRRALAGFAAFGNLLFAAVGACHRLAALSRDAFEVPVPGKLDDPADQSGLGLSRAHDFLRPRICLRRLSVRPSNRRHAESAAGLIA